MGDTPPDGSSLARITSEMDEQDEQIAQAMRLLLAAKERVLTLSEQRVRLSVITHFSRVPIDVLR
jgi:hypothetical protein